MFYIFDPLYHCLDAFVKAMAQYGFEGLERDQIIETGKKIREEIGKDDPEKAAVLTYSEIQALAIRREMEKALLAKKLEAAAEDWGVPIGELEDAVVEGAKK